LFVVTFLYEVVKGQVLLCIRKGANGAGWADFTCLSSSLAPLC